MRRLLLERLFVCVRDGVYLTRPHGRLGPWRRVTAEQKNWLVDLYLCAAQGAILLVAFSLYRVFFGDSIGYEDMFNVAGFTFGVTIFLAQAWLLADAPEASAPANRRPNAADFDIAAVFSSLLARAQASVVVVSFLLASSVLAVGLALHQSDLLVAGLAGVSISGVLLRRTMLRLWRSRR